MAGEEHGGFDSRGDRGDDRERGKRGGDKSEKKELYLVLKSGRLIKANKIKSIKDIYLYSLSIKNYQVVDFLLARFEGRGDGD